MIARCIDGNAYINDNSMAIDDRCVLMGRVSWLYRDEGVFCFSLEVSDGEGDGDDLDCETTS